MDQQAIGVALNGLHAYKVETELYLRGYGGGGRHDACCEAEKRRQEALEIQRAALLEREAAIKRAIHALQRVSERDVELIAHDADVTDGTDG